MVRFSLLPLALAAGFASVGSARNCTPNLDYCGSTLLDIGNYYSQIANELSSQSQPTDPDHIRESLFHCTGGPNGEISFLSFCSAGCQDAGSGNSDTC